ncbi:MAG: glycosyltransferase [Cyclobacteriaceae bacterium]
MIETIVWVLSLFYIIYFIFLLVGWIRIHTPEEDVVSETFYFSVVIPVRNESRQIYTLLSDLDKQDYPRDKYEVIVVDDSSEDNTAGEVHRAIKDLSIDIRLIQSKGDVVYQGKKEAITVGVSLASYDHIVATDGDCRVGENWLRQYNLVYHHSRARMVLGPVAYHESVNLFGKLQKIEFSALIGLGAASLRMNVPNICNGANISYDKKLFGELGGYNGNHDVPSGDDEFLLQKAYDAIPGEIHFNKSFEALCYTDAKQTLSEFVNQRIRWSAKWKYHKSSRMKLWGLAMFVFNLAFAVFTVMLFFTEQKELFLSIFIVKLITEYVYIYKVNSDLKDENPLLTVIFLQLIYPFYTIFMMISSFLKRYRWKGRLYL